MSGGVRVGVDIGGTFTDIVVREPGQAARIVKIPTTRGDPSVAVLSAGVWQNLRSEHLVRTCSC